MGGREGKKEIRETDRKIERKKGIQTEKRINEKKQNNNDNNKTNPKETRRAKNSTHSHTAIPTTTTNKTHLKQADSTRFETRGREHWNPGRGMSFRSFSLTE